MIDQTAIVYYVVLAVNNSMSNDVRVANQFSQGVTVCFISSFQRQGLEKDFEQIFGSLLVLFKNNKDQRTFFKLLNFLKAF